MAQFANENIYIGDELDSDGDLELTLYASSMATIYITEEEAVKLVEHLRKVFNL